MRCVVVGAGAWGLPAAAELAGRGHQVVLLERYGVGNLWSSSPGPTRLWRLTHPDAVRVRLARRGVEAMERLSRLAGEPVFLRRGLLWRDDESLPRVPDALAADDVAFTQVDAADVGRFVPGLVPDGRDAVWQADAGPVLAATSLRVQHDRFVGAGGTLRVGDVVRAVEPGPRVHLEGGEVLDTDVVVLTAGPGTGALLPGLGVDLPLRPVLEQVVHLGDGPGTSYDAMPCLYDGPRGDRPGLYAMPTPGVGYKVGLDADLRDWRVDDLDRTPEPALVEHAVERVRDGLTSVRPAVLDAQVCSWTVSPDGRFVLDRLAGGVVLACGDSGEGFKFSALMGLVLADLAEGHEPDADVAGFGLARFADGMPAGPHVLGR